MRATLGLQFERDGVRTILNVGRQDPPWKVIRAFPSPTGQALLHLNNVSGGVLGGDELTLQLSLGRGARAQVTSTGATRLYRARAGMPDTRNAISISLAPDSLLELIPDPFIPFAGSRCAVNNSIQLAEGSTLFWWETVWPGREASDEIFAFERFSIETEIRCGRVPIAMERIDLRPLERPLQSPGRMGRFRYFANLYICRPGEPRARWQDIETGLAADAARMNAACDAVTWGVSRLPEHGLVVRGLAHRNTSLALGLVQFWRASKLLLTGEPAVLPRKTY